jgi:hypothetical protein
MVFTSQHRHCRHHHSNVERMGFTAGLMFSSIMISDMIVMS